MVCLHPGPLPTSTKMAAMTRTNRALSLLVRLCIEVPFLWVPFCLLPCLYSPSSAKIENSVIFFIYQIF
jgi:hypothetical protein